MTREQALKAVNETPESILYVQAVEEDFGNWHINFRHKLNEKESSCNHVLSGYGREGLLKYVPEGTRVMITGKVKISFLFKNSNVDLQGPSCYYNDLTNEQYIAGLLTNGCYYVTL